MIITVTNQKGGSGKTSTALLIALTLAARGRKVLAVDTDPQGGLTALLTGAPPGRGLFDILMGEAAEPLRIDRGGLAIDLLPADYRLDKIFATVSPYEFEKHFNKTNYDDIVMDTPPTVQGISRAASMIADRLIIPADVSVPAIPATLYTLQALGEIKKTGLVYLIGRAPEDRNGFTADTARAFIGDLGGAFGGTIPKGITVQKVIANRQTKWTPARIEKRLKPILQDMQL